jgi:hypothetical protein
MSIQVSNEAKDFMERAAPGKFKLKHRGTIVLKVSLNWHP